MSHLVIFSCDHPQGCEREIKLSAGDRANIDYFKAAEAAGWRRGKMPHTHFCPAHTASAWFDSGPPS